MYVGTYFIYFWCHIGFCAGEISQEIVFPSLVGCDVEVCQMSMACLVKQNVIWFYVSVYNVLRPKVIQSRRNLSTYKSDGFLTKADSVVQMKPADPTKYLYDLYILGPRPSMWEKNKTLCPFKNVQKKIFLDFFVYSKWENTYRKQWVPKNNHDFFCALKMEKYVQEKIPEKNSPKKIPNKAHLTQSMVQYYTVLLQTKSRFNF